MNQIIQESWDYHKKLSQFMTKSSNHVDILKAYLNQIQNAHEQFAKNLKESSEKFYHDISQEVIENEILLFSYNYLCHFILNISHQYMSSSGEIQNRILEPFELFCENFKETNNNLLKNGNRLIESLESAKIDLLKKQEKYYKSAKEAEKYFKNNEKNIKFDISKKIDDVNNIFAYESLNKQASVEKTMEEYKNSISVLNKRWENYDFEFYSIFDNFDLNEESRIHFTKLNVSQMIKGLQEIYEGLGASMRDYNSQSFETRSKVVEENVTSGKLSSKEILKDLDNSKGLRNAKREEYVSYEMWKKVKGEKKQGFNKENVSDEKTNLIGERMLIDNFLNNLIRDRSKTLNALDSNSLLTSSSSFNIDSLMNEEASEYEDESKLIETLKNSDSMRRYFLEKACSQTKFSRDNAISQEKWRSLINITAAVLNNLSESEEKEYEFFYYLVSYLIKFYKDTDKLKKKRYLGAVFKSHHLFSDVVRWENLTYYLFHRKKLEEYQKNIDSEKDLETSDDKKGESKGLIKGFTTVRKRIEGLLDTNAKPVTVDEASLKLSVVDEVNVYLLHLELDHRLCTKILLEVSKKVGIDPESRNMLSTILERKSNTEMNKHTKSVSSHHVRRQSKLGRAHAVWLALDYLSYEDKLINILLVCKEWNIKLQRKIYQIALSSPDERLTLKKRLLVWTSILKIDRIDLDYFKVKEKYNLYEQNVFPVEDIITLDVQRSFHNHPQINTMILYNLLRIYAHYNEKVSYCQGMNYIMGFIYCLFREEDKTFRFFVTLIDKYMRNIFEEDLESLKGVFYQFDRLISIFIPDLSDHFKRESIESSLFSASWFITLFTNVFQHSSNSYTLFRVWDIFLLEGWKGFYKVCLWILDKHKEKLLKLKFDMILGFMNELVRDEIFTNFIYNQGIIAIRRGEEIDKNLIETDVWIRNLPKAIQKYNITSELLDALHEDYIRVETEQKELRKQAQKKQ